MNMNYATPAARALIADYARIIQEQIALLATDLNASQRAMVLLNIDSAAFQIAEITKLPNFPKGR
jgi:hypothetical protein